MHNILTHFLINNVFQDLIRTKNSRNISLRPYCLISRALNKLRMAQSASSRWIFVRWEGEGGLGIEVPVHYIFAPVLQQSIKRIAGLTPDLPKSKE